MPPRLRLGGRRHRILEIEDQGVGARRPAPSPSGPAGRPGTNRSERSLHPCLAVCIKRGPLHHADQSSRWLNIRCSKVTIPASGRELLSLRPTTSVSARSVSPMKTGLGIRTLS